MKRVLSIIVMVSIIAMMFCGFVKMEDPKKFSEKFVKQYFSVQDYSKIKFNDSNFVNVYKSTYSKAIHSMMIETAFTSDLNARRHISVIEAAVKSKYSLKVAAFKVTKTQKAKDGTLIYDYTVTLTKTNEDKKTAKESIQGQISVKNIKNAWKVTKHWFDGKYIQNDIKSSLNQTKAENKEKGFLWEVKSDTTKVYIFGSIHVAKDDLFPLGDRAEEAFRNSNNLVLEVDLTKPVGLSADFYYEGEDDIYNHLSEEGKLVLEKYKKDNNLNLDLYKKMKLIWLDSVITSGYYMDLGYRSGADVYFANKAFEKKNILELEGFKFQFDILNGFSDELAEKILTEDLKAINSNNEAMDTLYKAYINGDDQSVIKCLNFDAYSEEYKQKLIIDRNVGMAEKIEGYLNTSDSYFVVAGAGHFLGDQSVIQLLEEKGYQVKRIK